jgi:hypothetical protein
VSLTYLILHAERWRIRDLEKAVEALSQMLEEDISEKTVHYLRQRMLDKTVRQKGFGFIHLILTLLYDCIGVCSKTA